MNKIPMELRQLEYFRMAAKMRNLTRAAAELKVSQPNITVAIQKLEASLDLRLFDRSQKQFLLTAEGEIFLRRVEDALDILHDAMREPRKGQHPHRHPADDRRVPVPAHLLGLPKNLSPSFHLPVRGRLDGHP